MKKYIVLVLLSLFVLGGLGLYQRARFADGKLHVIFCNVGQGDGIFIRTPNGTDIVLDGGSDQSIIPCIAAHTPFWDRDIELMLLSHPHADHYTGLNHLLKRYITRSFVTEKLINTTAGFKELLRLLGIVNVSPRYVYAGDGLHTPDGVSIKFLGPTQEYIAQTSPNEIVGESSEFASLISLLSYGDFHVLFDGDSQVRGLTEAIANLSTRIDVLQVPHHGSRFGLDEKIITALNPKLAIISVGKNNYGHPSKQVLDLLADHDISILRTDKIGDIEMVSDGKTWSVRR